MMLTGAARAALGKRGMAEKPTFPDSASIASAKRPDDARTLEARLDDVAHLTMRASAADAIALSCDVLGSTATVRAEKSPAKWDALLDAALDALANRLLDAANSGAVRDSLSPAQSAPIESRVRAVDSETQLFTLARCAGTATVRCVCVIRAEAPSRQVQALLELGAEAALANCRREIEASTATAWRRHAAEAASRAEQSLKAVDEVLQNDRC
jgi:hypothetical protein